LTELFRKLKGCPFLRNHAYIGTDAVMTYVLNLVRNIFVCLTLIVVAVISIHFNEYLCALFISYCYTGIICRTLNFVILLSSWRLFFKNCCKRCSHYWSYAFLSHHTLVWGYLVYCVFLFVILYERLRISQQ